LAFIRLLLHAYNIYQNKFLNILYIIIMKKNYSQKVLKFFELTKLLKKIFKYKQDIYNISINVYLVDCSLRNCMLIQPADYRPNSLATDALQIISTIYTNLFYIDHYQGFFICRKNSTKFNNSLQIGKLLGYECASNNFYKEEEQKYSLQYEAFNKSLKINLWG